MWRTVRTIIIAAALIAGLGPLYYFAVRLVAAGAEEDRLIDVVKPGGQLRTGKFAGPVIGLKYLTPSVSGLTNEKGQFQCRDGEQIAFYIGGTNLGIWRCADRITLGHLDPEVSGAVLEANAFRLVNRARLLYSLDEDGNLENGIKLTPRMHEVIGNRPIDFTRTDEQFTSDGSRGPIHTLLAELDDAKVFTNGGPRFLRGRGESRNELRRQMKGIVKMRDVKIPMRDGSHLVADLFRPDDDQKHPVVVTLSIYGKESDVGCVCNQTDFERHEEIEDDYFSGNPHNERYENHESANTADFLPYGYAVMRVDGRGTCNSPGDQYPFSYQEAKDYYDVIEWAGTQGWSSGKVASWGASYTGWNQPPMASLQPPHLAAMVPISSDHKTSEDVVIIGGIYNQGFTKGWWLGFSREVCHLRQKIDLHADALYNKPFFYDPALHGPTGSVWVDTDMSKVVVPQWAEMPTVHRGNIHQRGTSDQFIRSSTPLKDKKLILASGNWMPDAYARVGEHRVFLDRYLKGIDNGIDKLPPVRLFVATGGGAGYHQYADNWPVPGTNYMKFYLDATPSTWAGDGRRKDFMKLSLTPPKADTSKTYSAQADVGVDWPPTPGKTACWAHGVSFVSDPVAEDLLLAGHMKLALAISSTSSDADVVASFRVMDENNREVNYSGERATADYPHFWGAQRVGHRKLDPKWSTDWRPIYTIRKEDYKPLAKGEIVQTQVELWANALRVKKGHRIRVDVQPTSGCGRAFLYYDPSYHDGADNTIYAGPKNVSYLQIPVISSAPPTTSAAR